MSQSGRLEAQKARLDLTQWLVHQAFAVWWDVGTDHYGGGFFEKIDLSGHAIPSRRRARVLGRQIYCFSEAPALGWDGSSSDAVNHGIAYLNRFVADDGLVRSLVENDGSPVAGRPDLYDHAFVLFSLAAAARQRSDAHALESRASLLLERLTRTLKHPRLGFEESTPRSLPLKANPHMHLLEAALAWSELGGPSQAVWTALADEIVGLALTSLISPTTGALHEFFDGDWMPLRGEADGVVEPGHQYEWAWLLMRWGRARGRTDVIQPALRMIEIAEEHGVDPGRNVAINELDAALAVRDPNARLWPQTERIKAWLLAAQCVPAGPKQDQAYAKAASAVRGLMQYFLDHPRGLYRDRLTPSGKFIEEPALASSLYHIVCAAAELNRWAVPMRSPTPS